MSQGLGRNTGLKFQLSLVYKQDQDNKQSDMCNCLSQRKLSHFSLMCLRGGCLYFINSCTTMSLVEEVILVQMSSRAGLGWMRQTVIDHKDSTEVSPPCIHSPCSSSH